MIPTTALAGKGGMKFRSTLTRGIENSRREND